MSPLLRTSALALLAAYLCAALLPCPAPGTLAAAHDGSEHAPEHSSQVAHAGHDDYVGHAQEPTPCHGPEPLREFTPACLCGCGGVTGAALVHARLGVALLIALPQAVEQPLALAAIPARERRPESPPLAIDPVPV